MQIIIPNCSTKHAAKDELHGRRARPDRVYRGEGLEPQQEDSRNAAIKCAKVQTLNRVQFETRRFQFRSSPPWATLEGWYYGFQTGRGLGIEPLHRLRRDLEQAVDEYRRLCSEKAQAIARLKTERRNRQLNNFLDRFLIKSGSIPGIGPAKTVTLASFGIESAGDISRVTIENIPGFGSATADKLLAWRATHERRFVYNPAPTPQDLQEQAKIEAEYGAKAGTLARQIAGSQAEMAHLVNTFRQRLAAENSKLGEIAIRRAQLEVDLAFLGISRPLKSRPPTPCGLPGVEFWTKFSPRIVAASTALSGPHSNSN